MSRPTGPFSKESGHYSAAFSDAEVGDLVAYSQYAEGVQKWKEGDDPHRLLGRVTKTHIDEDGFKIAEVSVLNSGTLNWNGSQHPLSTGDEVRIPAFNLSTSEGDREGDYISWGENALNEIMED